MSFERDNIQRMQGYASGEQPEDARTIKLNTNENPYPPAPAVNRVIQDFDPVALRRYPPTLFEMWQRLYTGLAEATSSQLEVAMSYCGSLSRLSSTLDD
jgi:histidinol-phosphate/aromatic aminotransferase/cobyric acid decarboxylase-like protein